MAAESDPGRLDQLGTLALPLMMLLAPQVRTRNLVVYLLTIAVFYFGVGGAPLTSPS